MMPFDEHDTKIQINAMKVIIMHVCSNEVYKNLNTFARCAGNSVLMTMDLKYSMIIPSKCHTNSDSH